MIFKDLLNARFRELKPLFDIIYQQGFSNQTHSGDMLLVCENAAITDNDNDGTSDSDKFYWQVGITLHGHSEATHYNFIREYVSSLNEIPVEKHEKLLVYDRLRAKEIEEIEYQESITIQIEMLIYLKIWESNTFMTRLYQLINIVSGNSYDWHFRIKNSPSNQPGLTRSAIIDFIIKRSIHSNARLADTILKCYNTQLRNAIAHSQYAIIGDYITLTNHLANKPNSVPGLSFKEWRDMFHETIAFHRLYISLIDRINEHYFELAKQRRYKCEIRISREFPQKLTLLRVLQTREVFKDWHQV